MISENYIGAKVSLGVLFATRIIELGRLDFCVLSFSNGYSFGISIVCVSRSRSFVYVLRSKFTLLYGPGTRIFLLRQVWSC